MTKHVKALFPDLVIYLLEGFSHNSSIRGMKMFQKDFLHNILEKAPFKVDELFVTIVLSVIRK